MSSCCLVLTTVAKRRDAMRIARVLVGSRLAACVSVVPGVRSIYRWKGKVCSDAELLLVIKTRRALYARLAARLKAIHPYATPEILRLPVAGGDAEYLRWLDGAVSS